jgi:hypothetical protein
MPQPVHYSRSIHFDFAIPMLGGFRGECPLGITMPASLLAAANQVIEN